MQPDQHLEPQVVEALAYIQSNKFMTPRLFHRKFHPHQTFATACNHLRALKARGLVLATPRVPNQDTYYCLTRPALRFLADLGLILLSREVRSPHINPFEREHDKRVLAMRIQFEAEGGLEGLFWLSDYEMRCGLQAEWKKALVAGRGWNLAGRVKPRRVHQRTPDGYFEGTLDGKAYAFVLEYEHSAYNRHKMAALILNLTRDFPGVFRLVVSRDRAHALRMIQTMGTFLRSDSQERALWGFNFFEKVDRLPFCRVPWARIGGGYLPFVKDPILKAVSAVNEKAVKPEPMPSKEVQGKTA
jgi:hypothetical protein